MAISLNGSTQYLRTTTPVTVEPFTFCAWGKPANATALLMAVSIARNATAAQTEAYELTFDGSAAGDPIYTKKGGAGVTPSTATTTTGFSANTYAHAAGAHASTTSRSAYINGGSKGTSTVTSNAFPNPVTNVNIGAYISGSTTILVPFNGDLAEVAIWNIALSDDDVASLSRGFKPYRIRPQSLVYYTPLVRDLNEIKSSLAITNIGSVGAADHPRVY